MPYASLRSYHLVFSAHDLLHFLTNALSPRGKFWKDTVLLPIFYSHYVATNHDIPTKWQAHDQGRPFMDSLPGICFGKDII